VAHRYPEGVLTAHRLTRAHGANVVLRDLDLRIVEGTRLGVVGPNGAGKTTLLELIAGDDEPDRGTVTRVTGCTVGYARQDITGIRGQRVLHAVVSGAAEVVDIEARLRRLEQQISQTPAGTRQDALLQRYGTLQDRFANASGYSIEAQARKVLAGLGFSDTDPRAGRPPGSGAGGGTVEMTADISTLSGGWMMRVALARLLLTTPDVLLLDEPTNHLDFDSAEWLATYLAAYAGALVAVSHDRWFLDRVVTQILELDGAAGHALYQGNYSAYVVERAARRQRQEAAAAVQAQQVAQTEAFIERFRAKASKARQVQSRIKSLDRLDRIEAPVERRQRIRLSLPAPTRSGRDVARLDGAVKRYGSGPTATTVFAGLDLVIERGWTVAVIGPNGAGKSTLLRLLAGLERPDAGRCELGHGVRPAYFAQHHVDALDLDHTLLAEMEEALGERASNPRALLGAFGFPGDTVDKRVAVCSGGERARLALAKLVVGPANLLCLDEPTNHLDLDSRELLTDALVAYEGTVVLVTHDRELIRATADRICVVGDGTATLHDGDLDSYLARRAADAAERAPAAAAPVERVDRRQQRREEAEARRRTQGLRNDLAAAESALEAAEQRLADVERALADPDTYDDPEVIRELSMAHKLAQDRAAEAEARWERLVSELDRVTAEQR
jgi:ATP-binding cassette subfamily F protein 3